MDITAIAIVGILVGGVVAIIDRVTSVTKLKLKNKDNVKVFDNMHLLEMRIQDLEIELREAKESILLLKGEKYEEIDK